MESDLAAMLSAAAQQGAAGTALSNQQRTAVVTTTPSLIEAPAAGEPDLNNQQQRHQYQGPAQPANRPAPTPAASCADSAAGAGIQQAAAGSFQASQASHIPARPVSPFLSHQQAQSVVLASPAGPAGHTDAALTAARPQAASAPQHQQLLQHVARSTPVLAPVRGRRFSTDRYSSDGEGAGLACSAQADAAGSPAGVTGSHTGDGHDSGTETDHCSMDEGWARSGDSNHSQPTSRQQPAHSTAANATAPQAAVQQHAAADASAWAASTGVLGGVQAATAQHAAAEPADPRLVAAIAAAMRHLQQQQELHMPTAEHSSSLHTPQLMPAPPLQLTPLQHPADPSTGHTQLAAAPAGPALQPAAAAGAGAPVHAGIGASQPLSSHADLLHALLLGLISSSTAATQSNTATFTAQGNASTAAAPGAVAQALCKTPPMMQVPAANSAATSAADPVQLQQVLQDQQQPSQHQQPLRVAVSAPAAAFPPSALSTAQSALLRASSLLKPASPGATAASPGLFRLGSATAGAAAVAGVMKRKASSSIPSSPAVLSPGRGNSGNLDAANPSMLLAQILAKMQAPPAAHPHGYYSSGFGQPGGQSCNPAGAGVGLAAAGAGAPGASRAEQVVGARGHSISRGSARGLQEPRGWTNLAAAPSAGVDSEMGFPTGPTYDPEGEEAPGWQGQVRSSTVACRAVGAARAGGSRGWADGSAGDEMEVDVSPSMAAAAAAMAGLADLIPDSLGPGGAAAAEAGQAGGREEAHSRKAIRHNASDTLGEGSTGGGMNPWQHCQEQQGAQLMSGSGTGAYGAPGDPMAAAAAAAGAAYANALAAVATAGMMAGSLGWSQQWYGSSSADGGNAGAGMMPGVPAMLPFGLPGAGTAAAAAAVGEGAAGGFNWGAPGQQAMGGFPVDMMMAWQAGMLGQQGQSQQSHKPPPRPRSRGDNKTGAAKPRKPRASHEPQANGDEPDTGGAAAAAAAASRVTAAGKAGAAHRGGGGRSSTSNYRGVTQHRYTLRWESHLWDPDAVRCKTAGSSRTKGKQTYLGGHWTEAEAAHAYDRAALVYWGENGFTNFPKSEYAGEMPLLSSLSREQVVANLRKISHSTQKFKPKYEGVYPHQALPGMFEARLYDVVAPDTPKGPYKYLGAFVTEEAAREALAQAALDRQQASAAMVADAGNNPAGSAGDPAPIPTAVGAAAAAAAAAVCSSE